MEIKGCFPFQRRALPLVGIVRMERCRRAYWFGAILRFQGGSCMRIAGFERNSVAAWVKGQRIGVFRAIEAGCAYVSFTGERR